MKATSPLYPTTYPRPPSYLWVLTFGLALTLGFSWIAHSQTLLWIANGVTVVGITWACLSQKDSVLQPVPKTIGLSLLLWVGWTTLSIAWSVNPKLSTQLVATDVWLPTLYFLAGVVIAGRRSLLRICLYALLLGIAWISLAALTGMYLGYNQELSSELSAELTRHGLIRWYPGPGQTSTLVVISLPVLYWAYSEKLLPALLCMIAAVLMMICGIATLNRFLWIVIFVQCCTALALFFKQRSSGKFLRPKILLGSIVIVAGCVALLVYAITTRHSDRMPESGVATRLQQTFTDDPRIQIWRYWSDVFQQAPVLGTGFGKAVATQAEIPDHPLYATMDHSGKSHPHNLLFSVAIQTGGIGLILFLLLIFSTTHFGWKITTKKQVFSTTGAALIILIVGMLAKNMTDDFYNKKLAILFWTCSALMVGYSRTLPTPGSSTEVN